MDEAVFWSTRLRPTLIRECQAAKLRHHFERVENRVADGTPDVDYCIAQVAGQIELKYTDSHPVSVLSQVLVKGKGLRRSQIIYASRRAWAGGLIWCAVGTPKQTWLIDLRPLTPAQMDAIATMSVQDMDERAIWSAARDGWRVLPSVLTNSR